MKSFIFFALVVALAYSLPSTQQLNNNWKFQQINNFTWYDAQVPGTVHLDLINNKIIPDPYLEANILNVQWVELADFIYTVQFNLDDPSILLKDVVELVFEGLDTHASVNLNNQYILEADNMWRTWRINVKNLLNATYNNMTIVFKSAVQHDNRQCALDLPLYLPAENTRIYSRKAQYHYGWDWGPRLVTCGIWRPVYIEAYNTGKLQSVYFKTNQISNSSASLTAILDLNVTTAATYTVVITNINNQQQLASQQYNLVSGDFNLTLDFSIANPQLWWVRGFGNQYLYNLTAQLYQGTTLLTTLSHNVGLRNVQLVQQNDSIGQSFYFVMNGISIYAKGGNYIPPDMFMPRVTFDVYNDTLTAAINANYNFLRVWGGGNYENDTFYELADQYGIMLWQEFMFADGMYSARPEYMSTMEQELIDNIVRLRNHPSIVVWVGNNEIQEGWNNWGWEQNMTTYFSNIVWGWYQDIFLDLIPSVLAVYDPVRNYWPTSPEYGYGNPLSYVIGDSHYWGVWANSQPIYTYITNVGRFVSEYGMQGMLSWNSLARFSQPSDWNFNSTVMKAHERHLNGWPLLALYMENYQPITNFLNFAYATQVMQKYALQIAIEAHRRNKPITMGTLTWQLNDLWPVFSWSTRDYYGTWKAPMYMQKKMYNDVVVSIIQNLNQTNLYNVYVISDKTFDFSASLTVTVMTLGGQSLLNDTLTISVPAATSQIYYTFDSSKIAGWTPNNTIAYGEVTYSFDSGSADNIYYFTQPIYMSLTSPTVTVTLDPINQLVDVSTNVFAMGVWLYINGTTPLNFEDNYFDLIPGRTKVIKILNLNLHELQIQHMTIWNAYDSSNQEPSFSSNQAPIIDIDC